MINVFETSGHDEGLGMALQAADWPTDNIENEGHTFFRAVSDAGQMVDYANIERCAGNALCDQSSCCPSTVAIVSGGLLSRPPCKMSAAGGGVFLATTSAAPFFPLLGFSKVPRIAVLTIRQLSSICPSSATIMKFNRPPT